MSADDLGKLDNKDLTVKRVQKAQPEFKAKSDPRDLKDQKDPQDQMEKLAQLDQEEAQVNLELLVPLACQEDPGRLEKMVHKESLVIQEFVVFLE